MAFKTIKIPATIIDGEKTYEPMTPVTMDAGEADSLLARWAHRGAEEVVAAEKAEKPAAQAKKDASA